MLFETTYGCVIIGFSADFLQVDLSGATNLRTHSVRPIGYPAFLLHLSPALDNHGQWWDFSHWFCE